MSEKGFWSPNSEQLSMMSRPLRCPNIAPNGFKVVKQEDMAASLPNNVMKRYKKAVCPAERPYYPITATSLFPPHIQAAAISSYLEEPLDFSESEWYNDSLSVNESTICAFEPELHFDCHCLFSFGFIRPNVKGKKPFQVRDFEFRVLKVTPASWSERAGKYFYRDDFKDGDFETIWECLDSKEFWKLMHSGSQFDYLCEKAAGDLIECDATVDIMDLCKRAYEREHGQGGSL